MPGTWGLVDKCPAPPFPEVRVEHTTKSWDILSIVITVANEYNMHYR